MLSLNRKPHGKWSEITIYCIDILYNKENNTFLNN